MNFKNILYGFVQMAKRVKQAKQTKQAKWLPIGGRGAEGGGFV